MEIENNKEEVPFSFYAERFSAADAEEMANRAGVPFENGAFTLTLLGTAYTVCHPEVRITPALPLPAQTFLLRYLLEGKNVPFLGEYRTFREMPWGELYIKPYTGRVLTRAAFTFGTRISAFRAAAEKMGATPIKNGDAGFEFTLLGDFKMRILVWEGDDEFPPNAQVLYSDNFENGFAPEDRVVAGDILITAIKAKM